MINFGIFLEDPKAGQEELYTAAVWNFPSITSPVNQPCFITSFIDNIYINSFQILEHNSSNIEK